MKIVRIFEDQLFAFHFESEFMNELQRLLKLWNDTEYLYEFLKDNKSDLPKGVLISTLVFQLIDNANDIDDTINEISSDPNRRLEDFFKPLDNQEIHIVNLSKQKGRKKYLRLYAIKIDNNCFIITGGTIKFHHLNKDRPHTKKEMQKIEKCRDYLKQNRVFDSESFYEFLIEQQ